MKRSALFGALLFGRVLAGCSEEPSAPDAAVSGGDAAVNSDAAIADSGEELLECDPMLGEAEACGGDITGTWRYVGLCGLPNDLSNFLMNCPDARITANDHVVTGSISWNADRTYGWMFSDDFGIALEVPVSCTMGTGSCEAFALLVTIAAGSEVTCMQRDQVCDCFSIDTREDAQAGIYDIVEGTITTTRTVGGTGRRQYYYCVREDRALLRRTDEGIVLLLER